MNIAPRESIVVPSSQGANETLHLGYRPCLDGLRAFAVLVVMGHHARLPFLHGGAVGVDVFFVLSGFLITSLLLEEWQKTGDISLKNFYLRRVLRLIPALVLFLLFIQIYGLIVFRGPRLWNTEKVIASVVFYVANWVQAFWLVDMSDLSHTWSLSIEEQFYVLWPLALLLLLRSGKRERWLGRLLVVGIVAIAVRRALMWTGVPSGTRIYFGSDTRCDELLAGCALGAWLHASKFPWERVRRMAPYMLPPAALLIVAVTVYQVSSVTMCTVEWPVVEVAVSVVILGLVSGGAGLLQKLLEVRPVVWIGKLSYGLYLWHLPILSKASGWHSLGAFRWLAGFALTFAAASSSYYLVELRFLRRKKRFASA